MCLTGVELLKFFGSGRSTVNPASSPWFKTEYSSIWVGREKGFSTVDGRASVGHDKMLGS